MTNRRNALTLAGLTFIALTAASTLSAHAAQPKVFQSSSGIAINGYDTVAYHTKGMPVEGLEQFKTNWNGATWLFSNAENLASFKSNPAKFAPQYGGYCAYAVSYGSTATTEPEAWSIKEGKLYLNYSLSIRKRWEGDAKGYISKANKNWPGVLN
jgi:YHS domain-containing protein